MNRVHRFVSNDFTLRIAAVDATAVVREMQAIQNTFPLASVAVGRSMVGALLMASHLKQGQLVGILVRGNGPLGSIYSEASFEGQVRGYAPNPRYEPANYDSGLSLKEAVGKGTLSVARHQPFQIQPHHGTVELVSGEIGEDIAHYLHQSHQIRSLVNLGVYLDSYGKVVAAGGVMIEVMPGVEEEIVEKIQKNAEINKPNISTMLKNGLKPVELVAPYLDGIQFTEIDHDYEVRYHCPCTKERVARALETLGERELTDMIQEDGKAEITCQMCGRPYQLDKNDLINIKDQVHKNSMH